MRIIKEEARGRFSMDDVFECANCGVEGDRYVIEEATRRCGTGLGEWYCMEGEGCNIKPEGVEGDKG
jgi:hypothetical protein